MLIYLLTLCSSVAQTVCRSTLVSRSGESSFKMLFVVTNFLEKLKKTLPLQVTAREVMTVFGNQRHLGMHHAISGGRGAEK